MSEVIEQRILEASQFMKKISPHLKALDLTGFVCATDPYDQFAGRMSHGLQVRKVISTSNRYNYKEVEIDNEEVIRPINALLTHWDIEHKQMWSSISPNLYTTPGMGFAYIYWALDLSTWLDK